MIINNSHTLKSYSNCNTKKQKVNINLVKEALIKSVVLIQQADFYKNTCNLHRNAITFQ